MYNNATSHFLHERTRDKTTKRTNTSTKINITTNHKQPNQQGHQLAV
jgi:hypothetical protein